MFIEDQMFMHVATGSVDTYGNWECDISDEELTTELSGYKDVLKEYISQGILFEVVNVAGEWIEVK